MTSTITSSVISLMCYEINAAARKNLTWPVRSFRLGRSLPPSYPASAREMGRVRGDGTRGPRTSSRALSDTTGLARGPSAPGSALLSTQCSAAVGTAAAAFCGSLLLALAVFALAQVVVSWAALTEVIDTGRSMPADGSLVSGPLPFWAASGSWLAGVEFLGHSRVCPALLPAAAVSLCWDEPVNTTRAHHTLVHSASRRGRTRPRGRQRPGLLILRRVCLRRRKLIRGGG